MLLLGHLGITVGAAALVSGAWSLAQLDQGNLNLDPEPKTGRVAGWKRIRMFLHYAFYWPTPFVKLVSLKLLLIGSMLPDLIDKPLFLLGVTSGRSFFHSLLFPLALAGIGLYLYHKSNRTGLLVLSAACAGHLLMDSMWMTPRVFFWPMFGFSFGNSTSAAGWFERMFNGLMSNPSVYIPEVLGGMLMLATIILIRRKVKYQS